MSSAKLPSCLSGTELCATHEARKAGPPSIMNQMYQDAMPLESVGSQLVLKRGGVNAGVTYRPSTSLEASLALTHSLSLAHSPTFALFAVTLLRAAATTSASVAFK